MARETNNLMAEYPLVVAALNTKAARMRLRQGELSLGYGVDGRFVGSLRPFPGFKKVGDLGLASVSWIKYGRVQKGISTDIYEGFVIAHNDGTAKFSFYKADGTKYHDFTTLAPNAGRVRSCTGNGRFLYLGEDQSTPQSLKHDGTNWVQKDMGCPTDYLAPSAPTVADDGGNLGAGALTEGKYRVAFRYYDEVRRLYSGLAVAEHEIAVTADQYEDYQLTVSRGAGTPATPFSVAKWTHVVLYRSIAAKIAGTHYDAGILWEESRETLSADAWSYTLGNLSDRALVYDESALYDPWLDNVGQPADTGVIGVYESAAFIGSDSTSDAITQMQFSTLHDMQPEVFPVDNVYHWSSADGELICFVTPGDLMYGWSTNAAFRISKLGEQLVITRVQPGRGATGEGAVGAVGRDMVVMTGNGLMSVDGVTAKMQNIGAVDRIVLEDWAASLDTVVIVTDGVMGATFVLNTTEKEMIVLWHVTGAVTMLTDCNFVWACEGPTLGGGPQRAYFVTDTGRIVIPDDQRTSGTMFGCTSMTHLNGLATGGSTTTLINTGASGWTDAEMKGAYVHVWEDDEPETDPVRAQVTSITGGNQLNFSNIGFTVASGMRYSVSPITFRIRLWPVPHPDPRMQDFGRRVVNMVGIHGLSYTVEYDTNTCAVWRIGLCRELADTPDVTVYSAFVNDTSDIRRWPAGLVLDGVCIEPWLEHIAADINFELLSLSVNGKIALNRQPGT